MLRSSGGLMVQAPYREILLKPAFSFPLIFLATAIAIGGATPRVNIKVDQVGYPLRCLFPPFHLAGAAPYALQLNGL